MSLMTKNSNKIVVRFLTTDVKTNKPAWSGRKKIHPSCLTSLLPSQIKRIVKFHNRKIIFLKEKYALGMIAICIIDN